MFESKITGRDQPACVASIPPDTGARPIAAVVPECSFEFRHVPLARVRRGIKKAETRLVLLSIILFLLLILTGIGSGLMQMVLVGAPVCGIIVAFCTRIYSLGRTGMVRLDQDGAILTQGATTVCLPWTALIGADLDYDREELEGSVKLTFDRALLPELAGRLSIFWMSQWGDRAEIDFDLRSVARGDQLKLISVITRLLPPTRIGENLSRFNSPEHNPGFTELWSASLMMTSRRESRRSLEPGDWLNESRFEIVSRLGAGGQGTAYEAIDHCAPACQPSRVVLKEFVLPVHGDMNAATQALRMVEQEADIIKDLDGEFVARVYDLFVDDCRAYLVREFIDGLSLKQLVEEKGVLSLDELHRTAMRMCDILSHLHGQSPAIVHRDFTPDNLIHTPDGRLKLIDFDIARQEDAIGQSNQVVGKPNYLAPEQFQGRANTQSDLYSLGGCLFFLSTGEEPKPISTSSPASILPRFDTAFDAIVVRATAVQCDQRYESIEALRADLVKVGG